MTAKAAPAIFPYANHRTVEEMDNEATAKQARLDGQLAAIRFKPITDNPHTLGTAQSRSWSRGWNEVEAKR